MRRIAAAMFVMLAFVGCGDDDDATGTSAGDATEISVKTTEYAFDAPATIEVEGMANITIDNSAAKEPHQAVLLKVASGKTIADVTTFLSTPPGGAPGGPPPFSVGGGPAVVDAGSTSEVSQALSAGEYMFVCFIPAPDGMPHMAKGMVKPLTVTGGTAAGTELPEGEEATANEFSFDLPELEAGETTIRGKNTGAQDHEFQVGKLADGKTVADAQAWFKNEQGPPPFAFAGGLIVGRGGGEGTFQVDLDSGTYMFFCLIPDDADQVPHVNKGMFSEVTIT